MGKTCKCKMGKKLDILEWIKINPDRLFIRDVL